ncbi:protein kinase domain-containing protein [Pseudactinotalea sp.]|uniref:protein kinase domain-containing protein n=1 Tax=Pseudactinotalea sp. TaxID=1926260 RepID=UPI003B3B17F2
MADDDWAPASASALEEVTGTGPKPTPTVEVPGFADLREVARGGDSIVYRARQLSVDRDVAIKVIQVSDPADAARFRRELEITVRLGRQHPHIVTVLDTTTASSGEPCLVMEFHDLGSLHDRLREVGPLPVSDVVTAGTAVADALAFAHSHGVLHRDVKPQNILVLPTSYVLSDFGIARMADAGHTATLERFSYRHASPQVLDGLAPTEADDVWSLGSTLFTLLDGRAPFASLDPHEDTALSYLRRVRTDERRTLSREDVPPDLVAFLDDCLVPDRDERLGTAAQALRRLRRIRTEDRSWNPAPPSLPEADVATNPRPAGEMPEGRMPDGESAVGSVGSPPDPSGGLPVADPEDVWAPGAAAAAQVAHRTSEPDREGRPDAVGQSDEPAEVAPSVLAHVERKQARPEEPDDDHTGLAPAEPETSRRRKDDGDDAPASTWRRVAAFIGGALLVGAAIGVGSAVIQGMRSSEEPTDPETVDSGPVPTSTDVESGDAVDIQVLDPAMSPRQLTIDRDNGTSVQLSWTHPEQDVDFYTVILVEDPEDITRPPALASVTPPLYSTTVEGLDPDGSECFAVVGVTGGVEAAGLSNTVCR